MKKFIIGLIFGGSALYLTLHFQPSWLLTTETCDKDSTIVIDTVKAKIEPVELSPAVVNYVDTTKIDSVK